MALESSFMPHLITTYDDIGSEKELEKIFRFLSNFIQECLNRACKIEKSAIG